VDGCIDTETPTSELLKSFVTQELMRWPGIEQAYAPILKQSMVFAPLAPGEQGEDYGTKRWKALHSRVIEHVRVCRSGVLIIGC
jgi:hypothetical protein